MKIFALFNSDSLVIPSLLKLKEMGVLAGVGIIKKNQKQLQPALAELNLDSAPLILERKNWEEVLRSRIEDLEIDTVWVLTFPWIIPSCLLKLPPKGFLNFHFGLLPKYKGADPIFWQFKNKETKGGLTVHQMIEQVDEGPVLFQEKIPIVPGETAGFHCLNLGNATPNWIKQILELQSHDEPKYLELEAPEQIFDQKPTENDLTIDWKSQSAEDIEYMVNGANPSQGGVKTTIANVVMYLMEVTPVDFQGEVKAEAGQIVHADSTYGLVVYCADGLSVRITIVRTREGYMSGVKLFNLGFTAGHKFE